MADPSLSIGKIFGVEVQLHWTFILILFAALLFGIFTLIVILFLMVLVHELAHSLFAKRYGLKVKRIMLIPLGGLSVIDLQNAKPDVTFKVAVAGPLASLGLALLFGLLYLAIPTGVIGSMLYILFLLNAILGVSNILPAFPLDGGRVLQSYLEEKHSQLEATKETVKVSKIIIVIYLVVSTIYILYLQLSAADFVLFILWNIIIVMFIYGGSVTELETAYVTKYADKLHVQNAMTKDYIVVPSNTKMSQLYKVLIKKGAKTTLFEASGQVHMVYKISTGLLNKNSSKMLSESVRDFAIVIPQIGYNARLSKAIGKMRYEESGIMAVMKGSKICGILLADKVEAIIALHMHQTKAEKAQ